MDRKKNNKKKIFVGLSGGVDSSVSVALLKDQGYDVTGVFIKVWQPEFLTCTWPEDRQDAMRVCAKLGIPFLTFDLEEIYKKEVIDYLLSEYKKGRTPNPDIMCNRFVKFGAFKKWSKKQGADLVATGHYAQIEEKGGQFILKGSADRAKDQTYFLWTLTQDDLRDIHFPIGHLEKAQVRAIAREKNLITAGKKDSQGLCFLGKLDMKEFLKHFIAEKPGRVVLESGQISGEHDGAFFYTLGERHGFKVQGNKYHVPLYVVDKNIEENTLIVSSRVKQKSTEDTLKLGETNWITRHPQKGEAYLVRTRHNGELRQGSIKDLETSSVTIKFPSEGPLTAPGQSAVLYRLVEGEYECVGGGIVY